MQGHENKFLESVLIWRQACLETLLPEMLRTQQNRAHMESF
jgi:hypothetical protein